MYLKISGTGNVPAERITHIYYRFGKSAATCIAVWMLRFQNDAGNRTAVNLCLIQSFNMERPFSHGEHFYFSGGNKKQKVTSERTEWLWIDSRDANRAGENRPPFSEQHLQSECDGSERHYWKRVGVFLHSQRIEMNASLALFHVFCAKAWFCLS